MTKLTNQKKERLRCEVKKKKDALSFYDNKILIGDSRPKPQEVCHNHA